MQEGYPVESTEQQTIRQEMQDEITEESGLREIFPTVTLPPLDPRFKKSILKTGIGIFGGGGTGKSNLAKLIAHELIQDPHIQVKIVDKVQNWIHGFDPILYQDMDGASVRERNCYRGAGNILYNCKFNNPELMKTAVSEMVGFDYELHWRYKESGMLSNWIVYIIEEAQSILANVGSKDVWNTYISEGRNFNISFIFIARRMTQLNAKLRENMGGFVFSRMSGYNNLNRVKAVANHDVKNAVIRLPLGDYIYWDGMDAQLIADTPLFRTDSRPVRWRRR